MTTTAPTPAAEATQMAHTPDPRPAPPEASNAAAGTRPRRWDLMGDNPLQTMLATIAAALLLYLLNGNGNRIDRLEDAVAAGFASVDARFAAQDASVEARFAAQDASVDVRFAEQSAKIDEINLKLTALIAALNKTDEVEAALEGRLLNSEPPAAAREDAPR